MIVGTEVDEVWLWEACTVTRFKQIFANSAAQWLQKAGLGSLFHGVTSVHSAASSMASVH
jgi:hypothetical protein